MKFRENIIAHVKRPISPRWMDMYDFGKIKPKSIGISFLTEIFMALLFVVLSTVRNRFSGLLNPCKYMTRRSGIQGWIAKAL